MTFEDLPPDWPTRPVTDPAITADLLDLVVGAKDRAEGAIGLLLCSPQGRLTQPVVVSMPSADDDEVVTPEDRRRVFDVMCRAMLQADVGGRSGLLVALARPGHARGTAEDSLWQEAAARSCAEHRVDLLGVWVMTPAFIRALPPYELQQRSA